MKNVLPEFVIKTGKTTLKLNDVEMIAIAYIAAKAAAKLEKIRKAYPSSKKYAEKALKMLEHNKNLATAFILFNSHNMESDRLYKPAEIKNEINKSLQIVIPDIVDDASDIVTSLLNRSKDEYVTSKDISKSLKALENEIGLIKIDTKEKVKKIKGMQKITFLGKPYFYKLPPTAESLKRIMSNPETVILTFRILIKLGLLSHLKFLLEASFYAVRDYEGKENVYKFAKVATELIREPRTTIDQAGWESYRNMLLSASENQIEMIADKLAEYAVDHNDALLFC